MAANETATATATATENAPKQKRNRKPSAFNPAVRVTISLHKEVAGADGKATTTAIGEALTEHFGPFATRVVSRTRKTRKGGASSGPSNVMVYVAPTGFTWASQAERGVRLDAETANLLRGIAEQMGLDANDPAAIVQVAKALATKATAPAEKE